MSAYSPPLEQLPIFDASVFVGTITEPATSLPVLSPSPAGTYSTPLQLSIDQYGRTIATNTSLNMVITATSTTTISQSGLYNIIAFGSGGSGGAYAQSGSSVYTGGSGGGGGSFQVQMYLGSGQQINVSCGANSNTVVSLNNGHFAGTTIGTAYAGGQGTAATIGFAGSGGSAAPASVITSGFGGSIGSASNGSSGGNGTFPAIPYAVQSGLSFLSPTGQYGAGGTGASGVGVNYGVIISFIGH